MTENKTKKISRRDAIKLLGAVTGATVLANLPSKWSTPEIVKGVLPAHAQASQTLHTLSCGADIFSDTVEPPFPNPITSSVMIAPADSGIPMNFTVLITSGFTSVLPAGGFVNTDGSGVASIDLTWISGAATNRMDVTWTFDNASDGSGSCTQILQIRFPT